MAADCGLELKPHNVTYISLWPGIVKTERLMGGTEHFTAVDTSPQSDTMKHGANADFVSSIASGESPEFAGKCIVALAQGKLKVIADRWSPFHNQQVHLMIF